MSDEAACSFRVLESNNRAFFPVTKRGEALFSAPPISGVLKKGCICEMGVAQSKDDMVQRTLAVNSVTWGG